MAVPAVSTLLRFEPSTFYRFVCGLVSVVAVIGFLPGVHTGTPLEVLDHVADWWAGSSSWTWPLRAHHWIANRSTQLGPIASVAMIVGVFAARGNDRSPDQWRGLVDGVGGLGVGRGGRRRGQRPRLSASQSPGRSRSGPRSANCSPTLSSRCSSPRCTPRPR